METSNRIRQWIATGALSLLASCYPLAKRPDADMLKTQTARWEAAVCRQPLVFSLAYATLSELKKGCPSVSNPVGCYLRPQARILILEGFSPETEANVILHELGHGLDDMVGTEDAVSEMIDLGYTVPQILEMLGATLHVNDGEGVMSPRLSTAAEKITQKDIDLICDRIYCKCQNPE